MKIGVAKERRPHESRVAMTPDTVKKYVGLGVGVVIETGAGAGANISDEAYKAAGAEIAPDEASALKKPRRSVVPTSCSKCSGR